jgi:DNA modification methylase
MIFNCILPGNNIDTLKTLPDKSVNCCITSPPYYGLRDYGTATWVGGNNDCNHFYDKKTVENKTYSSDKKPKGDSIFKDICKKCGARREDLQIGLEATPEEYIEKLILVFSEVKRVLRDDGTLWVNIGDSYAGSSKGGATHPESAVNYKQATNRGLLGKPAVTKVSWGDCKHKDLMGIPWMLAFALRSDGWYLRQDLIWHKPSPMPESVKDRFCKAHEYIFLFSKKQKYYFNHKYALEPAAGYDGRKDTVYKGSIKYLDNEIIGSQNRERERWPRRGYAVKNGKTGLEEQHHGKNIQTLPLRTRRSVWNVSSESSILNHFAMFPQKLILPCILCGCPENGVVLDPFMGSGTTAVKKKKNLRRYIGCEINPEYIKIAEQRIANEKGLFYE